jgi:ATP-GRASP peptide maturase of grasp-with-spasm system
MILILSQDFDNSTNDIIDWLNFYKSEYVRINGGDFLNYNFNYKFDINKNDISLLDIELDSVKVVLFRKWIMFNNAFNNELEKFGEFSHNVLADIKNNLVSEIRKSYNPLFQSLIAKNVKCIPPLNSLNIDKTQVLMKAKSLGINIPESIICNNKKDLLKFYSNYNKIITKPLSEVLTFDDNECIYFMRTSLVSYEKINELEALFFPSLFQEYIEKEVEIRSFFLEDRFYSMAIFSQLDSQTNIDFRNYNDLNPNRTVPFNLPISVEKKLNTLMSELKLNTGSLDLILTPKGDFYLLEINPTGQFGMVSFPCNYYLEKKIALNLINL